MFVVFIYLSFSLGESVHSSSSSLSSFAPMSRCLAKSSKIISSSLETNRICFYHIQCFPQNLVLFSKFITKHRTATFTFFMPHSIIEKSLPEECVTRLFWDTDYENIHRILVWYLYLQLTQVLTTSFMIPKPQLHDLQSSTYHHLKSPDYLWNSSTWYHTTHFK